MLWRVLTCGLEAPNQGPWFMVDRQYILVTFTFHDGLGNTNLHAKRRLWAREEGLGGNC